MNKIDENIEKWTKLGFPYVKKFIKFKNVYNKLKFYARTKTFVIFDKQGILDNILRQLLINHLWVENNINAEYVDFAWVGASIGTDYLKYDEKIYKIKTLLKNLLVGGGVKGDKDNKDVITNKSELYFNMIKYQYNIAQKYLMKTNKLKDIDNINDKVLIIRPIGPGAGGGNDVYVVDTNEDFIKIKNKLQKYKDVIATEYIQNPLLLENIEYKKFHLRMYFLVTNNNNNNNTIKWYLFNKGKIITAEVPYKNEDFTNPKIHDTHFKSTFVNRYFPEDLKLSNDITENILLQMYQCLEGAYNIIKNHVKCYDESKNCFEVFGVDFMITDDYKVKLIEINARHDYGVNDMNKENKEGFIKFNEDFFNWIYINAIQPIFPNYISYNYFKCDREKFEITEDIKFNNKYISIFIPLEDFNNIDILIDYFTEKSRIKAQKNKDSPSLYEYYYNKDLLSKSINFLQKNNKEIDFVNLRDSFYEFKEIYNASGESTLFYITLIKILFNNNVNNIKILDGAGGYGTRLLAAILLNAHYIGVEPNSMSSKGFKRMIKKIGDKNKQIMYEDGLPDAIKINELENNSMDLVMFSPPLFDGEIYSDDEKQSINLFKDFNTWKYKFLHKSIEILWSKLKVGGFIVFQSLRYNLIREKLQTFDNAEYKGVIARKTYSGRYKPNWIWIKIK